MPHHTLSCARAACLHGGGRGLSHWLGGVLLGCSLGVQGAQGTEMEALLELPLEALLAMEVSSASRKAQPLHEAPAAVFIVTAGDIRRRGVTNIPDALRMVPGVHVAQITANQWAVSVRGFNDRFTNKLLVLIDGRSVYRHSFSGVYWDEHDLIMEDIERIEVIRGPGATLCGANAVNGVINIITRKASDTRGGMLRAGGGNRERGLLEVRYGGQPGDRVSGRAWGKYRSQADSELAAGGNANDNWRAQRAGFRLDGRRDGMNHWMLQGDAHANYANQLDQDLPAGSQRQSYTSTGWYLLGRWTRELGERSSWVLQSYVDSSERDEHLLRDAHTTVDVEFQHRFSPLPGHDLVWGTGVRQVNDSFGNTGRVTITPSKETSRVFSAFAQDQFDLLADSLSVVVGAKLELNDYTGLEFQPSVRGIWRPAEGHTLWAGLSRAVRTPSRFERDSFVATAPGTGNTGNPDMPAETLIATEAGYRYHPAGDFSLDLALFHNQYDHVYALEPALPPNFVFGDRVEGSSYGGELAFDWSPRGADWHLRGSYAYLESELRPEPGSGSAFTVQVINGADPEHHLKLQLGLPLAHDLYLEIWGEYADAKPFAGFPVAAPGGGIHRPQYRPLCQPQPPPCLASECAHRAVAGCTQPAGRGTPGGRGGNLYAADPGRTPCVRACPPGVGLGAAWRLAHIRGQYFETAAATQVYRGVCRGAVYALLRAPGPGRAGSGRQAEGGSGVQVEQVRDLAGVRHGGAQAIRTLYQP